MQKSRSNISGHFSRSASSVVCNCSGGANGYGVANEWDVGQMLSVWGTAGGSSPGADANQDGTDLGLLLSGWGICP